MDDATTYGSQKGKGVYSSRHDAQGDQGNIRLESHLSIPRQKKGFFLKNYSKKPIIIDRKNFNPAAAYNLAGRVFWKNFAFKYQVALDIKEERIQEADTRLFELSGKKSTTDKYNDNYTRFWIAHNAMLAFIKAWLKQIRYKDLWQDTLEILQCDPELSQRLG